MGYIKIIVVDQCCCAKKIVRCFWIFSWIWRHGMRKEQSKPQVVMLPPKDCKANQRKFFKLLCKNKNRTYLVDEPRNRSEDFSKSTNSSVWGSKNVGRWRFNTTLFCALVILKCKQFNVFMYSFSEDSIVFRRNKLQVFLLPAFLTKKSTSMSGVSSQNSTPNVILFLRNNVIFHSFMTQLPNLVKV